MGKKRALRRSPDTLHVTYLQVNRKICHQTLYHGSYLQFNHIGKCCSIFANLKVKKMSIYAALYSNAYLLIIRIRGGVKKKKIGTFG